MAKLFINPGDSVIVEEPTYLCAVDAFKSYGANLVGVEMDDDGIRVDELEQVLKNRDDVKLLYTIPNYQNPTGRSMPAERRQQIAQLAEKYDLIVLEDNPYGEINFTGERIPSIKSYDQSGHVIYTSTFSKILAPGMRVGWLIADEELIPTSRCSSKPSTCTPIISPSTRSPSSLSKTTSMNTSGKSPTFTAAARTP